MSSRLRHPSMGRRSAESKLTIFASAADHSLAYFALTDSTSKTVATSQFGSNLPEFDVLTGRLWIRGVLVRAQEEHLKAGPCLVPRSAFVLRYATGVFASA